MPPDFLLPYFFSLSVEPMRVNICFPIYFCHLQNQVGHLQRRMALSYSSWCCPVSLLHHDFPGWSRKGEASRCNRDHQPIACLGMKGRLSPPQYFTAQEIRASPLLKALQEDLEIEDANKLKHKFCLCGLREAPQTFR